MLLDLCLVLLLDASGSVDAAEWDLQTKATAEAIASEEIVKRITSGPHRAIAMTTLEWSKDTHVMLPWTEVRGMDDARAAAARIVAHQRRQSGSTAVGDALLAAAGAMQVAPQCLRYVVDISSDGSSNAGIGAEQAVTTLLAMNVQVNALVIQDEIGVLEFYERTVSGFVMPASWEAYAQAIKAKLALEISGHPVLPRFAGIAQQGWAPHWRGGAPLVGLGYWRIPGEDDASGTLERRLSADDAVPTPDAMGLLLLGLGGLVAARRMR